jgi:hypothetical protein
MSINLHSGGRNMLCWGGGGWPRRPNTVCCTGGGGVPEDRIRSKIWPEDRIPYFLPEDKIRTLIPPAVLFGNRYSGLWSCGCKVVWRADTHRITPPCTHTLIIHSSDTDTTQRHGVNINKKVQICRLQLGHCRQSTEFFRRRRRALERRLRVPVPWNGSHVFD